MEKVLWCKGPFGQRSFDFGGPLAKGPLEKVLCDKVLLLKVLLPQPIQIHGLSFILFTNILIRNKSHYVWDSFGFGAVLDLGNFGSLAVLGMGQFWV